ncbi:MAG: acyltransferase, partial [Bacteroidales bacterium]
INTLGMINSGSWLFGYDIEPGKLQESLDKTLLSYSVFTGRCIGTGIGYDVDSKGPQIDFAESNAASSDITGLFRLPAALKADLDLRSFRNGHTFPLSIKVIKLADSTTLLSIAASHSCCDGATLYRFVNDWARTFRGAPIEKPLFDQTLLPSLTDSKEELMKILPAEGWYPVSLKALFSHIGDEVREIGHKEPETFFLPGVKSNAEVCKILSERAGNDPAFIYVVDMRGRCMPETFCGNAVANLQDISILYDCARLSRFFKLNLESMQSKMPFTGFDLNAIGGSKPKAFMVNNFCRFPIYGPDFGSGTPLKAYPNDLPDTIKVWPGAPSENGVHLILRGNARKLAEQR